MKNKPYFWSIFPSFLIVTLIASLSVFIFAVKEYEKSYSKNIHIRLEEQAKLIKSNLLSQDTLSTAITDSIVKNVGSGSNTRYTVIRSNGVVIGDSRSDPEYMDYHGDRPEVMLAIQGELGTIIRYSATIKQNLMYVAIPVFNHGKEDYVIRTSYPLMKFTDTISQFSNNLGILGILVLIILILVSFYLSRRFSKPLIELTKISDLYSSGDFSQKPGTYKNQETQQLAVSMKSMAVQIDEKIKKLTSQKNEQNAILESMVEGVIALDQNGNIILLNEAAAKFLEIDPKYAVNRLLHQVIRNSSIQRFVDEIVETNSEVDRTVVIPDTTGKEFIFKLQGTTIKDHNENQMGAVFVMHDITALKEIETIRKDFVANVSHELRTPLTAIKGFIETLLEGAGDVKEDREKFLNIVNNHVERLSTITQDLLTLSKLDKDEDREVALEFAEALPNEIMRNAKEIFASTLKKRDMEIKIRNNCNRKIFCNQQLIEEALINLVDNAIKYSNSNKVIEIECNNDGQYSFISVRDFGQGIGEEHIPRLFERFYRIDKARSRKEGGTGLGLSIVKHILNLHNGRIEVESKPSIGSKFTLVIPNNPNTEK
ncbi:MAG: ATP-binding protein [Candidatus Delongbacteria bacterium]|jgi:two-component system phosphate regulon sensor histidine kinase PhoR|nr:ATP-binding protein [Candidatus Delongbacteria bacterium]